MTGTRSATVYEASGTLAKRDATSAEADESLTWRSIAWPPPAEDMPRQHYAEVFRQGATLVPRLLCVVERPSSPVGFATDTVLVESRRSTQEKAPWKTLPPLRGTVESRFLRRLYLGESIAPFRLLDPVEAVIPWDEEPGVMSAAVAQSRGFPHLASWMRQAEEFWEQYKQGRAQTQDLALIGNWDYYGKLTAQMPPPELRVVYAASGTLPAAAIIPEREAVIEHSLYWTEVSGLDEARYLTAVLNSETTRQRAEHLQARGQWGARHFDRYILTLPIPRFDSQDGLHLELAAEAAHADQIAGDVDLRGRTRFVQARRVIRAALAADGVGGRIDMLVAQLLG